MLMKIIFYPVGFILSFFFSVLNIRFLNILTFRIGHLCAEPDCYIKEEILGKHPKYKAFILAPRGKVSNKHLLSYWEKYFRIIRSSIAWIFLKPLSENPFTGFSVHRYCSVINKNAGYPRIQDEYYKSGGQPLLVLTEFDRMRGRDLLSKLGMPRDAWFVCVHCREEGYIGREGQTYRNADISNYFPAMDAIVEKGGWVIRLGDPSMKLIPLKKNIIDYAHLDIKSDWMDIFLSASCEFFLGSASGLYVAANIFGVPAGTVNNLPVSTVLPYGPHSVGIPMFIRFEREKRYLSFKEVLNSSVGDFRSDHLYKEAGLVTVQNSSEDIKELMIEMFDRVKGNLKYTEEDERLQERFKSLMKPNHYSYGAVSRVGREFLRKYEYLL